MDASRGDGTVISSADLADEPRWPAFAHEAVQLGVRAMLSFQLFDDRETFGALNLYASEPNSFDRHSEDVGFVFASHAAAAMGASRKSANLLIALGSRDVIGQAKGILMERFKIGAIEAFRLMVAASQRRHVKVRDIAEELTRTGELRTD